MISWCILRSIVLSCISWCREQQPAKSRLKATSQPGRNFSQPWDHSFTGPCILISVLNYAISWLAHPSIGQDSATVLVLVTRS